MANKMWETVVSGPIPGRGVPTGRLSVHHAAGVAEEATTSLGCPRSALRLDFALGAMTPGERTDGNRFEVEAEAIVALLTEALPGGTLMRVFALLAAREASACELIVPAYPQTCGASRRLEWLGGVDEPEPKGYSGG